MYKKTQLCRALQLAFGSGIVLGALAPAAHAQSVTITGSSIRQISAETALPVTVLKAEDLAKAGVTNAEQALSFITSNQSITNSASSVTETNGGASFANLRGLGAGRTLVLVNGKRMVNNAYDGGNTAVDLNTIPYGAVDRIEVLNDGASAIYGSDAVAGVINFITRREFQGLTLNGSLSEPTKSGGGQSYDIGATGGIGSLTEQGWNLFGTVSYRSQSALKATDRSYASTAYYPGTRYTNPVTFPANYFQDTSANYLNPSLPNCAPPDSVAIDDTCNFDYVRYLNIIPKQEQLTLMAKGSYALNSSNTLSLEYLQGNNQVTSVAAPTPLQFLEITPSNPFFPGGSGLSGIPGTPASTDPAFNPADPTYLLWRTTNLGSRVNTIKNKTDRFLLDLQGSHQGWDYSVAALRSNSNVTNTFEGGFISENGAQAGLLGTSPGSGAAAAPWLNPFGAQTPEGQSYMMNQRILGRVQEAEGTLQGIKADASSEIYKMPAGPLTMAVGLEHYRDKVSFTNNLPLIQQAASSGLEGVQDASGSRDWTGVFVEFNVPLVKELEVNLALRYDHYSDFGNTTNPKAAFRWTPMKQILVRGSINSGFRAPSLYETYSPTSTTFTEDVYNDPVLCPGGVVDSAAGGVQGRDCDQFFLQQIGGNQNLQPETSRAWGIGMVFQPSNQTTLSVDYWNYLIEESIGVLGEGTIFGNSEKYDANFVRCSQLTPDEQASNDRCTVAGGNPLAYIVNTNLNLGSFKTSGLDFAAGWRSQVTDYGRFSLGWQATYVLQYEYQLESNGGYNNNLGTFFNGQPISRYRQVLNLGWQQGDWLVNLINRYSRGYNDQNNVDPDYYNRVDAVNTWDLAVTWTGVKNLTVSAGLANMFDQEPPFSNQRTMSQQGYDPRYGNPIGRAFLLRGVYTF